MACFSAVLFLHFYIYNNIQCCILPQMRYGDLVRLLGKQGFFDLATVVQLTRERRETIRIQLSRWCNNGKLISLRRGMYALPDVGAAAKISPALLANKLYGPSYISTYWALGFYGLIPEKVVTYTSVTQRVTKAFENPLGSFRYQHIKQAAFFGYRMRDIGGCNILIAEPEKALLDLWHLGSGTWDKGRMTEMRFQNKETVKNATLLSYAERYQSPRLLSAAELWASTSDEEEGAVEL